MAIWSRLTSAIAGIAVGGAGAAAVEPVLEVPRQKAWSGEPNKVLNANELAALVAQALIAEGDAAGEAKRTGFNDHKIRAKIQLALKAPGTAEALELWRRGRIDKEQMRHALHKSQLEEQYVEPVLELFGERLTPSDSANAVQQGFLANDGLLPAASPPSRDWVVSNGPFRIPVEQVALTDADKQPVSTLQEFKAAGIDADRARVLAELVGLPPGEEALLDMWRREIIDADGYATGLREGHTKTKWTAALSARFWGLLPPTVLVNLRLRGWIGDDEYRRRMNRHGYRDSQADDWFKSSGRPATTHQALVGFRRGGVYDGPTTDVEPYFLHAVEQSNIHPRWTNLLWAGRETYPSAFVMRRLVQDGALTYDEAWTILYNNGWNEGLAKKAARSWAPAGGAKADPHVTRAETQLWTTLHRSYVAGESDDQAATTTLTTLNVSVDAQSRILELWADERALRRKQLTPAQVKKAYDKLAVNVATGAAWTREEALAALIELGYSADAANDYLNIPSGP